MSRPKFSLRIKEFLSSAGASQPFSLSLLQIALGGSRNFASNSISVTFCRIWIHRGNQQISAEITLLFKSIAVLNRQSIDTSNYHQFNFINMFCLTVQTE